MSGPTDGYELLALDPKYDGSCPCATVVIDGVKLEMHCWRVCSRCTYAGVHYEGTAGRLAAERAAEMLNAIGWSEWQTCEGFR